MSLNSIPELSEAPVCRQLTRPNVRVSAGPHCGQQPLTTSDKLEVEGSTVFNAPQIWG